jgi:hypothetical protein
VIGQYTTAQSIAATVKSGAKVAVWVLANGPRPDLHASVVVLAIVEDHVKTPLAIGRRTGVCEVGRTISVAHSLEVGPSDAPLAVAVGLTRSVSVNVGTVLRSVLHPDHLAAVVANLL